MNYFAHALPFLADPYFLAGTGVPDWLTVCDRQTRVRMKHAERFMADADPVTAAVAGGLVQHLRDDARFHATRAFAETSMELAARVRRVLGEPVRQDPTLARSASEGLPESTSPARRAGAGRSDAGFRASFLGHLLVEVLLDAALAEEHPGALEAYYRALDSANAAVVQEAVNRMAARPTERLGTFISLFGQERILWDYLDDARLMVRLRQVMHRVGFDPLPDGIADVLPDARALVRTRRQDLLEGIPT